MKNKKPTPFIHGVTQFVKRELEISLALLLMLGFVVGFTYANAEVPLENGDVEVADSLGSSWGEDGFVIKGIEYQGMQFGAGRTKDLYTVHTGYAGPQDLSQTTAGVEGHTAGATYSLKITLDNTVNGVFYLHGTFSGVTVGDTLVNSPLDPIQLNGNEINIEFRGGDVLDKLVPYVGQSDTYIAPSVKALNVVPTSAVMGTETTRGFMVFAIDGSGVPIPNPIIKWTITVGKDLATIDPVTGRLTASDTAGSVTVKATSNGASAQVTILIKEPPKTIVAPITRPPAPKPADVIIPSIIDSIEIDKDNEANDEKGTETIKTETAIDKTTTQESVSNALDAFAKLQEKEVMENESTFVSEKGIQELLDATTQGFVERTAAKITLGFTQVIKDLKTMIVGSIVEVEQENGEIITVEEPSAFKIIAQFFLDLFVTGEKEGDADVDAATPDRVGAGNEEVN